MQIEITDKTYHRLSELSQGFDTPDAVINRLIDEATNKVTEKPTIIFNPLSEQDFKNELLKTKSAEVKFHYAEKAPDFYIWNAIKLTDSSNLKANLWSGFLRGWKKKGITKIELTVLSGKEDEMTLNLAHALGLSYSDLVQIEPEVHREDENFYLISFKNEDLTIINKIVQKVDSDLNVYLPSMMLDY